MNYLGKHLANVPAPKPPTSDDYLKILNEGVAKTWDDALTKAFEKELESDKSMPQPLSQMKDTILDALRKPAINQDLYNVVADNQKNEELKQKYFSAKDALLFNDIKTSVYNILCTVSPISTSLIENAILAGGCFASLIHSRNPNDYDIFILQNDPKRDDLYNTLKKHIGTDPEWSNIVRGAEYLQNPNVEAVFTFERTVGYHAKFQFIFSKFKTREELLNDFDFVHCCTSMTLDPNNLHLYITPATYEAIRNKVLKNNPKCNKKPKQWRIDKFVSRGWKIA